MMAHQKNVETGKNCSSLEKNVPLNFFIFFADVLVLRSSKARGACQPCGNTTREN